MTDTVNRAEARDTAEASIESRYRELEKTKRNEREAYEQSSVRFSFVLLALFLMAVVALIAGWASGISWPIWSAAALAILYAAGRLRQAKTLLARDAAEVRANVYLEHANRCAGQFGPSPTIVIPSNHAYAFDIDVFGKRSLLTRLDFTRTQGGLNKLVAWLTHPSERSEVLDRQALVKELSKSESFCFELEALGTEARGQNAESKLDLQPLAKELRESKDLPGWMHIARFLPLLTIGLWAGSQWFHLKPFYLIVVMVQAVIVSQAEAFVGPLFAKLSHRQGTMDALVRLSKHVEAQTAATDTPSLSKLSKQLSEGPGGTKTSDLLRSLSNIASYLEVRYQGLVHFIVNIGLLWDLQFILHLLKKREVFAPAVKNLDEVLGQIEAAASLAALLREDKDASMPELAHDGSLVAESLAHPLVSPNARVHNSLHVDGPGHAWVVTGSNMAGKSTLLRAVALNIVLAQAGGPTIAKFFRCPPVRLRASMRVEDSIQDDQSYFQAELLRLRVVVEAAEEQPPIFFVLDELLRGTNARARHLGARAVVKHLLTRGAFGLVATHDLALSELEEESNGIVGNVHFTDVFDDGEMKFDYRLRPGPVKGSNALRLLKAAGIDLEDTDAPAA